MSDMQITTHDALDNDHKGTKSTLNGKSVPYGFAGYVPQDSGFAVCHECAHEHYSDELETDTGGLVYGNDEWDFPGAVCEECRTYLDTYLLVYRNSDPELWYRVKMSEELGSYDEVLEIEEIANKVETEAYELGWNHGEPMSGEFGDGGEFEDSHPELPTDSARWANHTAPKLRALSGYIDPTDKGTYTEVPVDVARHIYNEGTFRQFQNGYYDRLEGNEFGNYFDGEMR